jgi:iron complex outermembrane receptor protein
MQPTGARAQATVWIEGAIVDSTTRAPIAEVAIQARRFPGPSADSVVAHAISDASGRFRLGPLAPGRYRVTAYRLGFLGRSRTIDVAGETSAVLSFALSPLALAQDPIVISVSRVHQKRFAAPASISVVDGRTVRERAATTPAEYARGLPGVDVSANGLAQETLVIRGFSSIQSGDVLVLEDGRSARVSSVGFNLLHHLPPSGADVDRIEVVRGPAAALYGPNADRGVLHIVTRSPFESRGTSVDVTGGGRDIVNAALRYAGVFAEQLGVRVSAQYLSGEDWSYVDSVEQFRRDQAIAGGADPDTLLIGARDSRLERAAGEAKLEWRVDPHTTATLAGGVNTALHMVEQSQLGALQAEDFRTGYVQSTVRRGRAYGQLFWNGTAAGDTRFLRTGERLVDETVAYGAQLQYGNAIRPHDLIYGFDLQRTLPRTGGTVTGRNEDDDDLLEAGGYAHVDLHLDPRWEASAALRIDDHNRFAGVQLSPRAALVYQPQPERSLRLVFNRAHANPRVDELFPDLLAAELPLGYELRVEGVPESGYHFPLDDQGPQMRSPFAAEPFVYLPVDCTLLWEPLVALLQSQGVDLSGIPAPSATQVGSVLATLDPETGTFVSAAPVVDLPALEPRITNTVEVGFKGAVTRRAMVFVDVYRSWIENFVGNLRVVTPNAFFDSATLAAYLDNYMSVAEAQALAAQIATIPMGTTTPAEALDPYHLILASRNFGQVDLWGADIGASVVLGERWSSELSYSWVNTNYFRMLDGIEDVATNAPRHKGAIAVRWHDDDSGWFAETRGRAQEGFPYRSGVYAGEVRAYALLDAAVGWRLGGPAGRTALSITGTNLLGDRHREAEGTPEIGRLVLLRLQVRL